MRKLLTTIFFICTALVNTFSQTNSKLDEQGIIAERFVTDFIHKDDDKCWAVFNKSLNPKIDHVKFKESMANLRSTLPSDKDGITLMMKGVKFIEEKQAPFYSFKYTNDVSKPAGFLFDVLFESDKSLLVAGFQPKRQMGQVKQAASSTGGETIITEREVITINSKEFTIRGVNLVHFQNSSGAITIQVEKELSKEKDLKQWAYKEGIDFAKWLFKQESYKKAVAIAKNENRTLISDIGVSFIDPESGTGYNVLIKEEDYK